MVAAPRRTCRRVTRFIRAPREAMDTSGKVETDRFCSLLIPFLKPFPDQSSPARATRLPACIPSAHRAWRRRERCMLGRPPDARGRPTTPELGRRLPGLAPNFHPGPLLVEGDDAGHVEAAEALGVR